MFRTITVAAGVAVFLLLLRISPPQQEPAKPAPAIERVEVRVPCSFKRSAPYECWDEKTHQMRH
jgi:hypothetical protein